MQWFTQYGSIFTIFLFTLFLAPTVIVNLLKIRIKYYGFLLSIPMIILIMGTTGIQLKLFIVFLICELILIYGYYYLAKRTTSVLIYFITLALSMLPVFVVKLAAYTPYSYIGFVGISYISFRIWQIIIEIRDGHIKTLPFLNVLYFITFFPTLSSGPIDRYEEFINGANQIIPRKTYLSEYVWNGCAKLLRGIVYKFGFAFLINEYVISALPEEHTLSSAIIYMYAYTLYLFFDFAGYSNLAIGSSYILGIKAKENFNKPFLAHNMKEFWERWHISLSTWLGDYVFKRFVLNNLRNGLFKSKKYAARTGNIVTMLVMGIWHGPYLFYIVYGLYQGIALVITDIYLKSKVYKKFKMTRYYDIISRVVCFQVIAFGMLIFSAYLFAF